MRALAVLVKIKPGKEEALRALLDEIRRDVKGNRIICLADSRNSHFVRFVILDDDENGPRLLLVSNYDGNLDNYIDELIRVSPGLDELWNMCEGYSGRADFANFIHKNSTPTQSMYIGFPSDTAEDIRNFSAIRKSIEQVLDLKDVTRYLYRPGIPPFLDLLSSVPQRRSWWDRLGAFGGALWQEIGLGLQRIFLSVFLFLAARYAQIGQTNEFSPVTADCSQDKNEQRQTEQVIDRVQLDTVVVQNEMTTYTTIKPGRLFELRLALVGTELLCRYGYPPGKFADVGSLHNFAWVILDNGKHLLFLSTFDGSWQNYMGDFVDKLVWGLDALYKHTYDYPKAGMKDMVRFTQYIIDHQFPAQVFYSGYPRETVTDIRRDRQIGQMLSARFDRKAVQQWLDLL